MGQVWLFAASGVLDPPIPIQIIDMIGVEPDGFRDGFFLKDISMNVGTVKFYNGQKGFGFITPVDGSKDVFIHISALDRAGLGGLVEGQKLQFDVEQDLKGRSSAANISLL